MDGKPILTLFDMGIRRKGKKQYLLSMVMKLVFVHFNSYLPRVVNNLLPKAISLLSDRTRPDSGADSKVYILSMTLFSVYITLFNPYKTPC